jgi:hypothetical protein
MGMVKDESLPPPYVGTRRSGMVGAAAGASALPRFRDANPTATMACTRAEHGLTVITQRKVGESTNSQRAIMAAATEHLKIV